MPHNFWAKYFTILCVTCSESSNRTVPLADQGCECRLVYLPWGEALAAGYDKFAADDLALGQPASIRLWLRVDKPAS